MTHRTPRLRLCLNRHHKNHVYHVGPVLRKTPYGAKVDFEVVAVGDIDDIRQWTMIVNPEDDPRFWPEGAQMAIISGDGKRLKVVVSAAAASSRKSRLHLS
jgi:hypothetical protein